MHPEKLHPTVKTATPVTRKRMGTTARMLVAMVATIALFATSGLAAAPASAQGATQFVFEGRGWGHGVGMSQNGARNMADAGFDHVGILAHYYPNAVLAPVTPLETIRVHIGDSSTVEMSSEGSMVFDRGGVAINAVPAGTMTVTAVEGGLQIGNAWTTATALDPVFVSFPQPIRLANNGHSYLWGRLQLTNRNGQVRVVEVLPLEKYVAGIAEMPAAWPLEALMSQAITARTYAHEVTLHRRGSAEWAQEYDISGSTVDQNYIGNDAQDSAWDQKWLAAVSATAGIELVDGNGPIRAYYSASNGGYTETAAYVFDNDVPYTVAAPDPYDAGGHDWSEWTRTYTQESISRWFNAHDDTAVGTLTAINVLGGSGASARIDKATVELIGTGGTKLVTGRRMMVVMNAGIFGEGGGLGTHLPGTFTTVGNGLSAGLPQPTGLSAPTTVTPDPLPNGATDNDAFTPPPGWTPEPGTGVPPGVPVEPTEPNGDVDAGGDELPAEGDAFTPPPGWTPEPGTGVPPGVPVAPGTSATAATPDPSTTPAVSVDPVSPTAADSAEPQTSDAITATDTAEVTPPADFVPEPGTGVPPGTPTQPLTDTVGESGGGDATAFVPPADFVPEPGTGVPPGQPVAPVSTEASASGVFLVERSTGEEGPAEATFEVVAPTDALAAQSRQRLDELQLEASGEIDLDEYIAAVAPRPVQGACTTVDGGVVCTSDQTNSAAQD